MNQNPIIISVDVKPKQTLEYVTINFTMDYWEINKKRQSKIKKILHELSIL